MNNEKGPQGLGATSAPIAATFSGSLQHVHQLDDDKAEIFDLACPLRPPVQARARYLSPPANARSRRCICAFSDQGRRRSRENAVHRWVSDAAHARFGKGLKTSKGGDLDLFLIHRRFASERPPGASELTADGLPTLPA
jgi:hypothetical protein